MPLPLPLVILRLLCQLGINREGKRQGTAGQGSLLISQFGTHALERITQPLSKGAESAVGAERFLRRHEELDILEQRQGGDNILLLWNPDRSFNTQRAANLLQADHIV